MTTNLEKALLQLGVVKTSPTNVGIATTTFEVINPNNLCSYTNTGVTTTASRTDIYSFKLFDGADVGNQGIFGVITGQNFQ